MIKLVSMLKRKEGLTPEEFHRHWREVHGPLIGGMPTDQAWSSLELLGSKVLPAIK